MPPRHREIVPLAPWLRLLLVLMFGACVWGFVGLRPAVHEQIPDAVWIWDLVWAPSLAIAPAIVLLLGRLVIDVEHDALSVSFGYLGRPARRIPLHWIERAEAIHYRPIAQFGGWGIRRGRMDGHTTLVYSLQGSTGVLLHLNQSVEIWFARTNRVLVGSRQPERLAEMLGEIGVETRRRAVD
jgi:hypothetical protein